MSLGNALRLVLMVIALVAVILLIRNLNSGSMDKAFNTLGLQAGGAGSPGLQAAGRPLLPGEERYNLCPTRITGFIWNAENPGTRRSIEEKQIGAKMHWMVYEPAEREISYLEIEKWLTSHCQIVVRPAPAPTPAGAANTTAGPHFPLEIHYVDGSHKSFEQIGAHLFRIEGQAFDSDDFALALAELRNTAQLKVPGL